MKGDKKDKKMRGEVKELNKKLKEKDSIKEKIEDIDRYCESLVKLEKQLEQEQLQANIEISSK